MPAGMRCRIANGIAPAYREGIADVNEMIVASLLPVLRIADPPRSSLLLSDPAAVAGSVHGPLPDRYNRIGTRGEGRTPFRRAGRLPRPAAAPHGLHAYSARTPRALAREPRPGAPSRAPACTPPGRVLIIELGSLRLRVPSELTRVPTSRTSQARLSHPGRGTAAGPGQPSVAGVWRFAKHPWCGRSVPQCLRSSRSTRRPAAASSAA